MSFPESSTGLCPEDIDTFNRLHEELIAAAEVLDGMQRAHGEIVEHTVSRAEGPVGMMGAACHVPGEASGTPRMVRCSHSATHETQGAFDHLRCPRSQTDAPFLARIEVACEEAFDVL